MAYKKYTDQDRINALELLALGHTLSDVHRRLNIPIPTIKDWKDGNTLGAKKVQEELNTEEIVKVRNLKKQEFVNTAWNGIKLANELIERRLKRAVEREGEIDVLLNEAIDEIEDNEETTYKEKQVRIRAVNRVISELKIEDITKLTTALGTLYDKQALASNEATVNAGVTITLGGGLDDLAD